MDRFIALNPDDPSLPVYNLKSNMDRFIVIRVPILLASSGFKIQYGQIYRSKLLALKVYLPVFKIQYGQIYRCKITNQEYMSYLFKIQYGQIYRILQTGNKFSVFLFKIQYGQIYRVNSNTITIKTLYLKSNMDRFIDNSKCSPLYLIFI